MGKRFCSLDQLYKYFSGNYVFPRSKLNENQTKKKKKKRKRSSEKFEVVFSRNQVKIKKKKLFTAICDHIRQGICKIF